MGGQEIGFLKLTYFLKKLSDQNMGTRLLRTTPCSIFPAIAHNVQRATSSGNSPSDFVVEITC